MREPATGTALPHPPRRWAPPPACGPLGALHRLTPLLPLLPIAPLVLLIVAVGLPPALLAWPGGGPAAAGGGASDGGGGGGGGGTVADAVSALVVLYAVLRAVRHRRQPLTRAAAVVLGLPVVGFAVAATGAADSVTALAGLVRYAQVFVLVPAAVLLLIRDRTDFRLIAWTLVALAGWQGGLGVHQYVTRTGASYMGSDIRAVGTFGPTDVMGMATVVAYGVVCAVGLALAPAPHTGADPSPGSPRRTARIAALGCALLLLVPLALSFSRGAWIATAVACGAQLALVGRRPSLRTGVALATAAAALAGGLALGPMLLRDAMPHPSMLGQRLDSIAHVTDRPDQSVVDRYTLWVTALDMWRARPVTGVGLKAFPEHRDTHAPLALSAGSDTDGAGASFRRQPLLSPHNMYLLVLAEQGLLGLTALTTAWAALLVLGARRALPARTRDLRPGMQRAGTAAEVRGVRQGTADRAGARRAAGNGGPARPAGAPQRRWSGWARCAVRVRFGRERCGVGSHGVRRARALGADGSAGARPRAEDAVRDGRRHPSAARAPHGVDCALVGCGLLVWQLIDFVYADIGGPSTVLTAVVLGVAAWWSLAPATGVSGAPDGGTARGGTVGETPGDGTSGGGTSGGGAAGRGAVKGAAGRGAAGRGSDGDGVAGR